MSESGPAAAPVARRDGSGHLLATKLHPPRPRRGTVGRARLAERGAADLPVLTVVSAPAGFGKTTLLAEWIERSVASGAATAWVSLDGADDDPHRFWAYVVAAVQRAVPGVGDEAAAQLEAARPGSAVASTLINELADAAPDVVLVLDDYHVIQSSEVHDAVELVVEHAPPQLHLVLSGRADPPLRLARLRARGDLLELRAADLRFTVEETAAYFGEAAGLDLAGDDIVALEARTEGWVAALQLAALSMQGRDDASAFIAHFAGDDRFVVD